MDNRSAILAIAIVLIIAVGAIIIAFTDSPVSDDPSMLPTDATNIRDLGNGWATFNLPVGNQTLTFLYHRSSTYYNGFESVTCLPSGEVIESPPPPPGGKDIKPL